ncbi:MAG: methyl-accepting chemotaxis protein [Halieaceae bacterium]|jgi:methyl-accepting chemotaxis protein|nr:methyl-accepting chemotaxis protein [Halieaceae bacterium]
MALLARLQSLTIQRKIYVGLAAVCVVTVSISLLLTYYTERSLSDRLIRQILVNNAEIYFDAINTMMLNGTIAQRSVLQEKMLQQDGMVEARLIRSPLINEVFGPGGDDQAPRDELDELGLRGEEHFLYDRGEDGNRQLTYLMPIRNYTDYRGTNCTNCHIADENAVLGTMRMTYNLRATDRETLKSLLTSGVVQFLLLTTGFVLLGYLVNRIVVRRLLSLRDRLAAIRDSKDLTASFAPHTRDELGAVTEALDEMFASFRKSMRGVQEQTRRLLDSVEEVLRISLATERIVVSQKGSAESVASNIGELEAHSKRVAEATSVATAKSRTADDLAHGGVSVAETADASIHRMRESIAEAVVTINALSDRTREVADLLDVINDIAEQTNLLALNANIEAARAGNQGKGFAVVADEVRSLATSTREFVEKVQGRVASLRESAGDAVSRMDATTTQAEGLQSDIDRLASSLRQINESVGEIEGLNAQIVSAAEEQKHATQGIGASIERIRAGSEESAEDAIKGREVSEKLAEILRKLESEIKQFRIAP